MNHFKYFKSIHEDEKSVLGRFREGPAFVLGVDREGRGAYDGCIHLFHKREFNEKMEPEIGKFSMLSGSICFVKLGQMLINGFPVK